MASTNIPVTVLEVCQLHPSSILPDSATELSLPLTFLDLFWFKFHPVERIFFYELTLSTSAYFNSVILPILKRSLSLTLLHFLPLAGNLIWPPQAAKPFILYTTNDTVCLTVAESKANFHHLSSNKTRDAADSRPYVPELRVSDSKAATIAFQITLFPNQGFCIGVSSHHAVYDGKSVTLLMKAWAHLCKQITETDKDNPSLPPELTPFLDRTIIPDPEGIDMINLNNWLGLKFPGLDADNPKSLKLLPTLGAQEPNKVRGTFELRREDIKRLRKKVISQLTKDTKEDPNQLHVSSFVLIYAYTIVCLVKAKGIERNRKVLIGFMADCRARLNPPIPANYIGNCVDGLTTNTEAGVLMEENGVALLARKLGEVIKGLEKGVLDGAKEKLGKLMAITSGSIEGIGVAGSPRFEVYGTDFGWGRPKKVEVTHIDRGGGISMAESRDGNGGVEVGVVLNKDQMEIFDSLFVCGLKDV